MPPQRVQTSVVLRGTKGNYELLRSLKGSTDFKAKVLSGPSTQLKWAVVKSAATDWEKVCLKREHHNYQIDEVASSPYIRALHDTVVLDESQDGPPCLVFEWMDQDLRVVSAPEFRSNPKLPRAVSHGVLSALHALKAAGGVHGDISINNIFVSDMHEAQPIAKLGDLGMDHGGAWSIAKMIRLVGQIGPPVNPQYEAEFKMANQLLDMVRSGDGLKLINRLTWRGELQHIPDPPVPSDLLDFIGYLLVVDPDKRPTASEALLHPYLQPAVEEQNVITAPSNGSDARKESFMEQCMGYLCRFKW
ncbi:CMGC kinase [Pyrenophora seminiperda CCB06]|uniref:CMGC kinase n=1 Tax=Pyrenophora seminiperda CCB06 TaxID=1302712 RepID=A0A3M7LY78_9PLEO|nr:CMGC kinase [Pyrenophora seminiperda CCB06]